MQLREALPYDVRHIIAKLPRDGELRHKIRRFTMAPRVEGRARSVKAFAEDIGLSVYEIALPRGKNGRLVSDSFSDSGSAIEINKANSVQAKRFTVLHEIGHFFRHNESRDELSDDMYFDLSDEAFYVDKVEEREANEFAEALLFGDGQLAAAASMFDCNVSRLATYFGVNEMVVQIALKKLSF